MYSCDQQRLHDIQIINTYHKISTIRVVYAFTVTASSPLLLHYHDNGIIIIIGGSPDYIILIVCKAGLLMCLMYSLESSAEC